MPSLKKKENHLSEEHFHDEWAAHTKVKEIDPFAPFEGETSPEYKNAMRLLGPVKGKKILNLGCGLGEEAVYLASRGAKVTAIDISQGMLDFTQKLAKRHKVENRIVFKHMSADDLKFRDKSFDAVFGCNILHHVPMKKSLKEIKRVLKPNGVAVFSEPLAYNSVVNIYRAMAHTVRTDHETPLTFEDLSAIKKVFPKMEYHMYQLFTLLIFVWFFIGEGLHPNKTRYWKKIIVEADRYKDWFRILYLMDTIFLRLFPFLRRYCWVVVVKFVK